MRACPEWGLQTDRSGWVGMNRKIKVHICLMRMTITMVQDGGVSTFLDPFFLYLAQTIAVRSTVLEGLFGLVLRQRDDVAVAQRVGKAQDRKLQRIGHAAAEGDHAWTRGRGARGPARSLHGMDWMDWGSICDGVFEQSK